MSEQNNISPLLDGFTLGSPISEHHGVICRPAIKENSNKKYIVKVISLPASQSQFDALLLAGAYKDPGDAMEYFRANGEDILKEAELLKKLSRIEGFLPYDGWQMEPITRRRLGYEIYLVGSYKRSLEKFICKNACTHLEAVNLGLDLCAALSVCRQSGFLYVDLKPSNVFVSEKKEFRIGDLGFLSLDAMRYASLPERYFSPYTPPELLDPMAPMNLTVDTYAVGMILYQLYNDGHLPFTGTAPLETLPSPCNADYEMAEIIMKAIHPDPEQRWTDPKDLGKAIASYMQRNSINDVPITSFCTPVVPPEDIVTASGKEDLEKPDAEAAVETVASEEHEQTVFPEEPQTEVPDDSHPPNPPEPDALPEPEEDMAVVTEVQEPCPTEETEDSQPEEEAADDSGDEPSPPASGEPQKKENGIDLEEISEEVAKIISKADHIIAHEIPEDAIFPVEEEKPDPFAFAADESDDLEDAFPEEPLMEEEPETVSQTKKKPTRHFADTSRKEKWKRFFSRLFMLFLFVLLCLAGFWYYQNIFLQAIDSLSISGTQNQITVLVDTGIEESRLTVHCVDEDGKRRSGAVEGGKVIFSDLKPSTQYTIQLDMSGFHKLIGKTSDVFTTEATTQILSFQAIAGSEHGSVMLDFTVAGEEPNFWNIRYSAEGEEQQLETITDHSAMITGLTVGKTYTFTLDGGKDFDVGGMTSISYLASRLILAEDITVLSSDGSEVTVTWKTPGDVVVDSWNVRCYDGYGFEEQVTVTENTVSFTGIDASTSYTVEITAAGMTQPARTSISADPIHVSDIRVDESTQTSKKVSWDFSGTDPEGGWLLLYTVDGSGDQVIPCEKAVAEISPWIPGANYAFVIQAADNRTVFNNRLHYAANAAENFTDHRFHAENVSFKLLKTPEDPNWHYETLQEDVFTNTFHPGESASMVLSSSTDVYVPGNKTSGLFVFRDAYGNVLSELVTEVTFNWKDIWMVEDTKTAELDIPRLPATAGEYVLELYFNGSFVTAFDITVTE